MSASLEQITKTFGDFVALRDVDVKIADGEIHALLGANGSGKSTLSKCLSGVHGPDVGRIRVGTTEVTSFADPLEATAAGVRMVHQDSPLVLSLSITENYALAHGFPTMGPLGPIRWRRLRRSVEEALARFGVPVAPDTLAAELTPARRAMVTLALALDDVDQGGVAVLILDEVTAHIPEDEALEFLERVRRVPELGVPVLMVTHRFKEVLAYADQATVLSDGRVVHSGPAADLDMATLIAYMTAAGRGTEAVTEAAETGPLGGSFSELVESWQRRELRLDGDVPALELTDLRGRELEGFSLRVETGEIVGIAGMPESGTAELPEILAGSARRDSGSITVAGRALPRRLTPAAAIDAGLLSVPRDRHAEGGAASLTLRENMTLPGAGRFWHRETEERSIVQRFLDGFDVRPPRPEVLFGTLSGGNQQKVVIAKWMIAEPRVLVLDNPTAGVDPAARQQIFQILHQAAELGLAVIVFSSEPEQFAQHCSRVIVLSGGRVAGELAADSLAAETINQKVTALSS